MKRKDKKLKGNRKSRSGPWSGLTDLADPARRECRAEARWQAAGGPSDCGERAGDGRHVAERATVAAEANCSDGEVLLLSPLMAILVWRRLGARAGGRLVLAGGAVVVLRAVSGLFQ